MLLWQLGTPFILSVPVRVLPKKLLYGCIAGILIFALGNAQNERFWQNHNEDFCEQLRADKHCVEDENGFSCDQQSSFPGSVGTDICGTKLANEDLDVINKNKRVAILADAQNQGIQSGPKIPNGARVSKLSERYEKIARRIISSPQPEKLDFENDLVALYNCYSEEYEDFLLGEQVTSGILNRLIVTSVEKERYIRYSASKGRNITPSLTVAALPAGDKQFGCKFLGF